ncbi:MAG TPA: sigma-70 family RNA polymerase sigma factor [Planctomycetota bacterium]|nr:sigma-70 family RNA polymerase sigma factor [Planctomycetota bacterium]
MPAPQLAGETPALHGGSRFATTRWSVVLAAAGPAGSRRSADALASLCGTYWYPLYAYVRRQCISADDAQDLTQGFFLSLLEKDYLHSVERERGRFRSFLLASLKHFLADQRDRAHAVKRGGGHSIVSLDELREGEERYAREPARGLTAEQIYERRWALTVLASVLAALQRDYQNAGKTALFERLGGFLTGDDPRDSYAAAADALAMSEGAVKVAVHRLRQRYGQLLADEIAETVATPEAVEDEIRHLMEAVGTA